MVKTRALPFSSSSRMLLADRTLVTLAVSSSSAIGVL
jgi:hypothetical protein